MADNLQRIEELKRELAGNPQSRQFYQLGELLRRDGRNAEAAEVLGAGVAVHPKYVAAWVALGRAWLEVDHAADAAHALDSALALDRQNPVAWRLLGEARLAAGDRWGALEAMSKALELVPGDEVLQAAVEALAGQTAPPSEPVPLFSAPRPTGVAAAPGAVPPPPPASAGEHPPLADASLAPSIAPPEAVFGPEPASAGESAAASDHGRDVLATPAGRVEFGPAALEGKGALASARPGEVPAADDALRQEPGTVLPPAAADPFSMSDEAEPLGVAADWDVFEEPAELVGGAGFDDVVAAGPWVATVPEVVEVASNVEVEPFGGEQPVSAQPISDQPVSTELGCEKPVSEVLVSEERVSEELISEELVSAEVPLSAREVPIEIAPRALIAPEAELPVEPAPGLDLSAQIPEETPLVAAEVLPAAVDGKGPVGAEPFAPLPEESAQVGSEPLMEVAKDREGAEPANALEEAGKEVVRADGAGPEHGDSGEAEAPVWVDVDVSGDPYVAAPAAPVVTELPSAAAPPEVESKQVLIADVAQKPDVLAFQAQQEPGGESFVSVAAEAAKSSGPDSGLFDVADRPSAPVSESSASEASGQDAEQVWLPATMTMARLLIQQQQLDGAVEVLERVIAREPGNEEAVDLLELVRDMMQPDTAPLPPLSLRSRKIAVLQRWQASMIFGRERGAS